MDLVSHGGLVLSAEKVTETPMFGSRALKPAETGLSRLFNALSLHVLMSECSMTSFLRTPAFLNVSKDLDPTPNSADNVSKSSILAMKNWSRDQVKVVTLCCSRYGSQNPLPVSQNSLPFLPSSLSQSHDWSIHT